MLKRAGQRDHRVPVRLLGFDHLTGEHILKTPLLELLGQHGAGIGPDGFSDRIAVRITQFQKKPAGQGQQDFVPGSARESDRMPLWIIGGALATAHQTPCPSGRSVSPGSRRLFAEGSYIRCSSRQRGRLRSLSRALGNESCWPGGRFFLTRRDRRHPSENRLDRYRAVLPSIRR